MSTDTRADARTETFSDPWSMEAKTASDGGNYTPLDAGTYPATIVGLIDAGHHPETNDKGKGYWSRKLFLLVELTEERPDGRRYVYCKQYTWSLSTKSKFRGVAQAVTGRSFSDGDRLDPRVMVGKPCMAGITNTERSGKNGQARVYDNLDAVTGYPKGFPAPPEPTVEPLIWSVLSGGSLPALDWLPRHYGRPLGEVVAESREARGLADDAPAPGGSAPPLNAPGGRAPAAPPLDAEADDIPF